MCDFKTRKILTKVKYIILNYSRNDKTSKNKLISFRLKREGNLNNNGNNTYV